MDDNSRLVVDMFEVEEAPAESVSEERSALLNSRRTVHHPLHFARIQYLKYWLPQIDPSDPKSKTWQWYLSRRPRALGIQLVLTLTILVINTFVTIWGIRTYGTSNGIGLLMQGSCSAIQNYNSVLHLAINILSTAILGASNYCMQILVAPRRSEVDRAHLKRKWMDIGIPSVRNLAMISPLRVIAWAVLCLSSGTLHLLWNSSVFSSFPYVMYTTVVVTDDYLTNTVPWNTTNPRTLALFNEGHTFERLNNTACIERYMDPLSGAGDVIVVTTLANNSVTYNDSSSLLDSFQLGALNDWETISRWMCSGQSALYTGFCSQANLAPFAHNWSITVGASNNPTYVSVAYCLSQGTSDMKDWCELHFSEIIMIVVCCMNVVKVVGIWFTWYLSTKEIRSRRDKNVRKQKPGDDLLITIGDAMESFLDRPDETTAGMCLVSQLYLEEKKKGAWVVGPRLWKGETTIRKFKLASWRTWMLTMLPSIILIILVSYLLKSTLHKQSAYGLSTSLKALWSYGFGHAGTQNVVELSGTSYQPRSESQFWQAVSFANSWQLEVSILYLFYNSLLTRLCVGVEWSHFAATRPRFLRTSCPNGMQRSTYFLSLPFRYAIPLSVSLAMLHWFVSQSVFLAQSAAFTFDGMRNVDGDSSRVCFSSIGIICSLGVGILLVLGLACIGFQKVTFRLPVASTSSAAISAACHRPDEDEDASLLPVRWGVIPTDEPAWKAQHCSFTTCVEVEIPLRNHLYE